MSTSILSPYPYPYSPPPSNPNCRHRRSELILSLSSCSSTPELTQLHSQLIRLGLSADNDSVGRLIKLCTLFSSPDIDYALKLFRTLPNPDQFIYNTLIRSSSSSSLSTHLYSQMLLRRRLPNNFTFPSLIKSVSAGGDDGMACQVHAHVIKFGFCSDGFCQNNLISMYLAFGLPADARRVFDKMDCPDVVSWTTMISGLARIGSVDEARDVFDGMAERSSASWNAMIAAYVQADRFKDAFDLFNCMRAEGVEVDKFLAASMLAACTGLGALDQGEWIHRYIKKSGIQLDSKLATSIIDMYCKCGCLEKAYEVFNGLSIKGQSSWNCMIGGLAVHGQGEAAIELFQQMEKSNVMPDDITLLNVLSACAHSGLVSEGKYYFDYIIQNYGVKPKLEHYGCLVDMLGRAGMLEEAEMVIQDMPMDPDSAVLGALLGACKIHRNVVLGEKIGKRVIELDPNNSGRYVLLANLYAGVGRWDDVANVRRLMDDRGVSKEPGLSMMEMDGAVSEFIAGGKSHPEARDIYAKVNEMLDRIRLVGYVPDTSIVLHDIDEEEKENPLYYHSEKLAIAYGLLKTPPGETIRISKNLRVCKDCHEASKLVSRVYDRNIIVRDRNRFHHFSKGECSCNDFW